MNKRQKQIALIAGGLLAAWLLYSYVRGRQTANATPAASDAGGSAVGTTSSDYAALAGQEQGDIASLQGQNQQLLGQEQSDVAAIQGQEGQDVTKLTTLVGSLGTTITNLTGTISAQSAQIAAIATGEQAINRADVHKVTQGGKFAEYYQRVTGNKPPAQIATNNFIYQAWKSGVKAANLQTVLGHPSSQNTQVQHPNGNHQPQNGAHKNLPTGGASVGAAKGTSSSGTRK